MGADSTLSAGVLVDRFQICELIGEGGMGAIYRAIDTRLGRNVALKVVRASRLAPNRREEARQRFLREALAISKVEHRNVVRVLDFGFWRDTPYLAMEYLRGRDLGEVVRSNVGFLPVAEVADLMLAVCAAVRACHDVGVIHRDLKPSNIFLCEGDGDREVKILDFGISKAPTSGELTREGEIVGTPQYLAPEQLTGKAVPETDQYAIGVLLYECLTQSLPYQDHENYSLLHAIVGGEFAPPRVLRSDIPEALEAIILRAMRAAPADRFESVHALGRELWTFASPGARASWRAYYFEERPKPQPKTSAHEMPLVEQLARGLTPKDRASDPAAGPAPRPAPAPAPAAAATPSAPSRKPGSGRWVAAFLIVAAASTLAGARWWTTHRAPGREPPQAVAPPPPVPAPPPPAETSARPAEVAPIPTPPKPTAQDPPAPSPSTHVSKPHRHKGGQATRVQRADAVPILP